MGTRLGLGLQTAHGTLGTGDSATGTQLEDRGLATWELPQAKVS